MTRSPAFALATDLFSAGRRGFAIIVALLAAAAALSLSSYLDDKPILQELTNVALVISLILLFGLLNYTEHHPRSGLTGFPTRLFTLPASTFLLVSCPMICGLFTVVALYSAWVLLVFRPMGRPFLLTYPAVVLACGMVCYLAILWSLAAHRLARLIALSMLGTGLVGVALLPMIDSQRFSQTNLSLLFITLTLTAYISAFASVRRQRHAGGVRTSAGLLLQRAIEILPVPTTPFPSTASALFALEFRRAGLILPLGVFFVCLFAILTALAVYPLGAEVTAITFLWLAPLPLLLSTLIGKAFSSESSLPSFISIRPITSGDLLLAKMRAAACSVAVSWLLVLTLIPLWLQLCDTTVLSQWWHQITLTYSNTIYALLPLLLLSAMLFTWKLMIASTPTGLLGKPRLYYCQVFLFLALLIFFAIRVPIMMERLAQGGQSLQNQPKLRTFLATPTSTITSIIAASLILKIALANYFWRKATLHRHLSSQHARLYFAFWLIATGILTTCAYLLTSAPQIAAILPRAKFFFPMVILTIFPIARIPLAAIALSTNRTR
jgi:hypothetical protein